MTTFIRVLEELVDKQRALVTSLGAKNGRADNRFEVDPDEFKRLPRSVFAYWVSDRLRKGFSKWPELESDGRVARRGVNSNDDHRFLRLDWECRGPRWIRHLKGGPWSPYYSAVHMVVNWGGGGAELEAERVTDRAYKAAIVPSRELYFRPGLTWSLRTKRDLSVRAMPSHCIIGSKGPAIVIQDDPETGLLAMLAAANSRPFLALMELQLAAADARRGGAARSYEVGVIQRTPVPDLTSADEAALAALARRAWSLKRSLDTRTETSHAFTLPALLQVSGDTLAARATAWAARVRSTEDELAAIQAEIDERCFALYGISDEDRRSITEGFGGSTAESDEEVADEAGSDDEEEAEADTTDTASLAAELVSWAVGVAFGRFDVRLATGERELPGEPEPFDPLPVCSPGMLTGADGLPLDAPPAGYPLAFPADGVLVDDPGHRLDLTRAVRDVFETVFGSRADAIWQEAGDLLDPRGHDVVAWLRSGFFEHHLKRHSKSRRKAPIVWQLGSGRSGIWAFAHRLTRDSLFAIGNDIAAPRLATEERRLASLRAGAGASPSARDRAEIDAAETAADEARTVLAEIRSVGPLWNPDLDDGIVLVSAPLWRLVPHKAWQKELKGRWDELVAGKYDWAHLAMHLWPERVVPKSAADRSLAIAHGLEDVFWAEGPEGKWAKRGRPTKTVEDLIAERTSPAVKAALVDLQGAPALAGTGRGRGRS